MWYTEYMTMDYLVVAGRMTRENLEQTLTSGFVVQSWKNKVTESVALVFKTHTAVVSGREQQERLYRAGYVGVHLNPTEEVIRRVVVGVLTCDTSMYAA
jgi:hypothetical protein